MSDQIRPDYYKKGGIEVFDIIRAFGLDFFLGNVVKYVCRAGRKGNELEDLIKARTYLDCRIAQIKAEQGYKFAEFNALSDDELLALQGQAGEDAQHLVAKGLFGTALDEIDPDLIG